jgi:hypothetical protein
VQRTPRHLSCITGPIKGASLQHMGRPLCSAIAGRVGLGGALALVRLGRRHNGLWTRRATWRTRRLAEIAISCTFDRPDCRIAACTVACCRAAIGGSWRQERRRQGRSSLVRNVIADPMLLRETSLPGLGQGEVGLNPERPDFMDEESPKVAVGAVQLLWAGPARGSKEVTRWYAGDSDGPKSGQPTQPCRWFDPQRQGPGQQPRTEEEAQPRPKQLSSGANPWAGRSYHR